MSWVCSNDSDLLSRQLDGLGLKEVEFLLMMLRRRGSTALPHSFVPFHTSIKPTPQPRLPPDNLLKRFVPRYASRPSATSSLLPRQTTGYLFSLTHPLTIYTHLFLSVPFSGSFLDSPSTQIFTVETLQPHSPDLSLVKKFRGCSHSLCSTSLFRIASSSDDAEPYLYAETTVATSIAAEILRCSVTAQHIRPRSVPIYTPK